MRKFLFFILAFIYIVASTGATMHMHYCMGRLADTGFFEQEGGHCSLCGMEKSSNDDNGCCNDKEETVKISIDQQYAAGTAFHFEQPFTDLIAVFSGFQPASVVPAEEKVQPISKGPPRSRQVPDYLMHRHFTI